MGDVGCELFVAIDAFVKRTHHATQSTTQAANFVRPRCQIRYAHATRIGLFAGVFVSTDFCGGGQIADRVRNRGRQNHRQTDRNQRRNQEHLQDQLALATHDLIHFANGAGHDYRAQFSPVLLQKG